MKISAIMILAGAAIGFAGAPAWADEVNLLFGTTLPAQVHLNMRVLHRVLGDGKRL